MGRKYVWVAILLALMLLLFLNLIIKIPMGGYRKILDMDLPYYRAEIRAGGSGPSVVALNLPEGNYTVITQGGELLPSYYNGTHLLVRTSLIEGVNTLLAFHSPTGYTERDIFDLFDDFTKADTLESENWRVPVGHAYVKVDNGYLILSGGGGRWDRVESRYLELEPPYVIEAKLSCQADFCWICLAGSDVELKDELGWNIPEGLCAGISNLPPSNPWGGIGIKVIGGEQGSAEVTRYENMGSGALISGGKHVRMVLMADDEGISLACCDGKVTMHGYEAPKRFKLKLLVAREGTLTLDWIRVYRYVEQRVQTEKSRGVISLESVENEIRVLEVVDIPEVVELRVSCDGLEEKVLQPRKGEAVSIPLEEGAHECIIHFAVGNKSIGDVGRIELVVPSLIDKLFPTIAASVAVLVASLGYLLYLKLSRYRQSKELEKILE